MMATEARVDIARDIDIVTARQHGRELAGRIGFTGSDPTLIATAISEVARNIIVYSGHGEIRLEMIAGSGREGLLVVASDDGPGIPDVDLAMRDGFSTGNSLGIGLPGARRLMDEFEILSEMGKGTTITMRKWRR